MSKKKDRNGKDVEKKLTLEKIEDFMPFIRKHSKNVFLSGYTQEDLKQEGVLSLIKANNRIRSMENAIDNENFNPAGYYCTSIKNNFNDLIRRKCKFNTETSLDLSMDNNDDNGTFSDNLPSEYNLESQVCNKELREDIKKALATLSSLELNLITFLYLSDHRPYICKFIEEHNLSYYEVNRIKKNAFEKMKKFL